MLVSLALLIGSVLAAKLPSAGAAVQGCPCVLLIEVDGLEPKDVTPDTTPFLWELAHPSSGQMIEDTRAGWTWQAPRAVMSAGTAANAGALLTGSYPKQADVPADEFLAGGTTRTRLQQNPIDAEPLAAESYESEFLLQALPDQTEATAKKDAAAFVGNPALSGIADVGAIPDALKWWPSNGSNGETMDPQNPPSPAYCDAPRRLPDDPEFTDEDRPSCSAPDMVTLNRALTALNGTSASRVALSYIHLAELGVIKRRDGDYSPENPPTEPSSPAAVDSVPHALAQMDAAIAQFVQRYQNETQSPTTGPRWEDTFVFVVGSHGYETSAPTKRLPAPAGAPEQDLESYVEAGGRLEYSPYGSMASIHATGATAAERVRDIESIAAQLKSGGPVEQQCKAASNNPEEKCIREVLYVRDDVMPASTAGDAKRLSTTHPHWNFDALDSASGTPTRSSGDLLVITEPGWGAGRALPQPQTEGGGEGDSNLPVTDTPDPYLGVAGGPRNRAVAAIVNGPGGEAGVRQVEVPHYPVTKGDDTGPLDETPEAQYASVAAANAMPEDDTGLTGHQRQPENVDFAPTIAALLGIGIESDQLAGRFLQEAFHRELAFPDLDVVEDPAPEPEVVVEDVVVEQQPEVIVLPPPPTPEPLPPPPAWDYRGLIRGVRAAVGDKKGRLFPNVPARADLSYLILRADFGKPLASVKLSFYKRQKTIRKGKTGARRTVVRTLASFDPFSIKRAKNAKLTLRVPKVFKPSHVGVVVQRARKLSGGEAASARRAKRPLFKAYGARVGGIYRIKNASRLHTRAPKRRPGRRG